MSGKKKKREKSGRGKTVGKGGLEKQRQIFLLRRVEGKIDIAENEKMAKPR